VCGSCALCAMRGLCVCVRACHLLWAMCVCVCVLCVRVLCVCGRVCVCNRMAYMCGGR